MKLILPFITILLFVYTVSAYVYSPKILTPNSKSYWRAGQTYTVVWDPESAGIEIPANVTGSIMLGYLENGNIYNEHLYWTLADNFKLVSGSHNITLPSDLATKHSYIIVLFGDSGNASPEFTIVKS
ncbi:hypothetical protein NQZ79_g317 [Umbelopsis isabellina]|nr:hypothetical protein NQZ79_g317 [Umbelopsis isabellina]